MEASSPSRLSRLRDAGRLRDGRSVTSYDVAQAAGVSQSAVSRCFTPGASVSRTTRAKVMQAVDALGYRPNAIARSLITQRSNLVALVVANISYHPEFTASLSRRLSQRGRRVLLFTIEHEADAEQVVEQIWQYRVDGVIAAVRLPATAIEAFARRYVPLVFINRTEGATPLNAVCCDQVQGEALLVDRLLAAGHRRFGIIAGPADSVVSMQRVEEARARLARAGIADVAIATGAFDHASGRRAMAELCERAAGAPSAIICANDLMAIGAIDAAREDLGLRVPDDVSVVGFDGLEQGQWAGYRLVTIRQPIDAMADAAIDMLLARLENPALGPEKRMFAGELIEGASARI